MNLKPPRCLTEKYDFIQMLFKSRGAFNNMFYNPYSKEIYLTEIPGRTNRDSNHGTNSDSNHANEQGHRSWT